jgi:hypothetical protein
MRRFWRVSGAPINISSHVVKYLLHLCNRWVIVASMTYIAIDDRYEQKVLRIAGELGITRERAALACEAFEFAFAARSSRAEIFEIIDRLDAAAAAEGEAEGLIVTYAVEIGLDGPRVRRYADRVPESWGVKPVPAAGARVLVRVRDNFPTEEFLGPLIVERPGFESTDGGALIGVPGVFSATEPSEADIYEPVIYDIQRRPTFPDRFPFLVAPVYETRTAAASLGASSSALAGSVHSGGSGHSLSALAASHSGRPISGLSPPATIGDRGHSGRKLSRRYQPTPEAFARSGSLTI